MAKRDTQNVTALSGKPPKPNQGQSAYETLLAEIMEGRLLPGARLREAELAERLNISRTPVRDAIRQLEAEGLVVHQPRVGATVRTLDYAEVMELYEMRAVLEGTAARLAARTASDIELSELAQLNEEMGAAAGDGARSYALNRQFHLTLLDAAKNRFLTRSMHLLQRTLLILGPTTLHDRGRAKHAVEEHDAVLAALQARDGDAAETLMRRHIEAAHRLRLRQLRERVRDVDVNPFSEID